MVSVPSIIPQKTKANFSGRKARALAEMPGVRNAIEQNREETCFNNRFFDPDDGGGPSDPGFDRDSWPFGSDDYDLLKKVGDKAAHDVGTEAKATKPTPATEERFLRDVAVELLLQGGMKADDLGFMFEAKPDGARVKGLNRVVTKLLDKTDLDSGDRMAGSKNLIEEVVADFEQLGIVGERNLALAVYLVGTSRMLDKPLSAIVQGGTSPGKSFIVDKVTRLFPEKEILRATRMSREALFYYDGGLANKFVVAGERSRKQDDDVADATGALRQLQSEGRISKLVTEQNEGKFVSQLHEQTGPISYVETTTLKSGRIFSEDLNRALLLKTDASEKHTRAILKRTAAKYDGQESADKTAAIVAKHHAMQSRLKQCAVVIPFAKVLVAKLPAKKVEARRVGPQVLSMIEAVTLLHQHQREKDKRGRLIATLKDYEIARSVLVKPLGESLGVPVGPARFFEKLVHKFSGKEFTTKEAQDADRKASKSAVEKWMNTLVENRCVERLQPAKGPKPAIWKLTGSTPQDAILPDAF